MSAEDPGRPLRAVVDRDECFGFAYCVETLPAVFSLDAEGKSVALDVDADHGLLAQAADACPRGAITLRPRPDRRPVAQGDTPEL
jgi:ferredoxin